MVHKHLKVYEQFTSAEMVDATKEREVSNKFETETTDFVPTDINAEGDYVVSFTNADGEDCSIVVTGANDPKYSGNTMISTLEVVDDSSSDGKNYSVVGMYDESSDIPGEYELKRVMLEEK